jgi:hypothetical protein
LRSVRKSAFNLKQLALFDFIRFLYNNKLNWIYFPQKRVDIDPIRELYATEDCINSVVT